MIKYDPAKLTETASFFQTLSRRYDASAMFLADQWRAGGREMTREEGQWLEWQLDYVKVLNYFAARAEAIAYGNEHPLP